ncbi:MAG: type IV pilin protein [Azoarcus sp.]|nr:type IV pilin protein [Azoarcus sp.]
MAIPNYQSYMIKTRRATAAGCLLELSQFMERFYTTNLRYDQDTAGNTVALPATQCQADLAGYYAFALETPTARTYTLSAVPQGAQGSKDPSKCGNLTIDETGKKRATGEGADAGTCWR